MQSPKEREITIVGSGPPKPLGEILGGKEITVKALSEDMGVTCAKAARWVTGEEPLNTYEKMEICKKYGIDFGAVAWGVPLEAKPLQTEEEKEPPKKRRSREDPEKILEIYCAATGQSIDEVKEKALKYYIKTSPEIKALRQFIRAYKTAESGESEEK